MKPFYDYTLYDILFNLGLYEKIEINLTTPTITYGTNILSVNVFDGSTSLPTIKINTPVDLRHLFNLLYSHYYVNSNNVYYYCIDCHEKNSFKVSSSNKPTFIYRQKNEGNFIDVEHTVEKPESLQEAENFYVNKFNEMNNANIDNFFCQGSFRYEKIRITCTHDESHIYDFYFLLERRECGNEYKFYFSKVGQYPSFSDLRTIEKTKYLQILKNIGFHYEYNRALGLFSAGIGIGSFVYLRRIIENLVFQTYERVKDEESITREDFETISYTTSDGQQKIKKRPFNDKITLLGAYLPKWLVEHAQIYGIMSIGVHELTEEECLSYFPTILKGIELILEQMYQKTEEKKLLLEADKELSKIYEKIKTSK